MSSFCLWQALRCGVWCRGRTLSKLVPQLASSSEYSLRVHLPSGSTSPGPCKAECRAAGRAPRERMRLAVAFQQGRITGCPSSGHIRAQQGKEQCTSHSEDPDQSYGSTRGVRPAWPQGPPAGRSGAGAVLWRSGHPRAPGASAYMWQDALRKNT